MILILAAFALLVVAIGVAVVWTERALRLTREGVTGQVPTGPWLLVLGAIVPEPSPEPSPAP